MLGTVFLNETQDSIEDQQGADNRTLRVPAEEEFQNKRNFQHPRYGRPELPQEDEDRMGGFLLHRIGANSSEPLSGLFAGQAGRYVF